MLQQRNQNQTHKGVRDGEGAGPHALCKKEREKMDLSVWYLMGAILVFFMQCGFAMVETGFTRAKNAGNIIMKNLMDFCIGTVVFILLGYGIMNSENYFFGLIGMPEYQMFTNFYAFDWSNFFFQLCSAPQRPPSSPAPWRSAPNSWPTACTPASSARWSTPSRPGWGLEQPGLAGPVRLCGLRRLLCDPHGGRTGCPYRRVDAGPPDR